MADRTEITEVLIPAETAIASFQTTSVSFQRGRVDRLEVRIPPGPSGLVGFRIGHSGQVIIPRQGSAWFITDNDKLDWDLDNYPTGSAWEIYAYNTDVYDHTLYFWWHLTELGTPDVGVVTPIPITPVATAEDVGLTAGEIAELDESVI